MGREIVVEIHCCVTIISDGINTRMTQGTIMNSHRISANVAEVHMRSGCLVTQCEEEIWNVSAQF
jgi:hypothetical protein